MAGAVYTATGRFNGLTGKSMCLKVKETGAQSNTATSWTTGTGAWKDLPGIHYTALANGDTVNVTVIQKTPASGELLLHRQHVADDGGRRGDLPAANLSATAASETEIDLTWDPSG